MKYSLLAVVLLSSYVSVESQKVKPLTGCETVSCPKSNGQYAIHKEHPFRCDSFCKCDWGNAVYFKCPDGLEFNKDLEVCIRPLEGSTCNSAGQPGGGDPPAEVCPTVECPARNPEYALHLPNPDDCGSFCKCDSGVGYLIKCPEGLHYNAELKVCDWPSYANCGGGNSDENGCLYTRCPLQNTDPLTRLPNPEGCSSYCECENGVATFLPCQSGLHFNELTQQCESPGSAGCALITNAPTENPTTSNPSNTNPTTPRPPPINGCELVTSCPPTNEGNATHLPNPTDCGSFCKCDWGFPVWFDCPDGLHFNPVLQVCDWPENAGCQNGGDPTEPAPTTPGGGGGNNPTTPGATRPPPINGCELVTSCPPTNEGNATHLPNPTDCGSFCKCDWGYPVWFDCPDGLHFNPVLQVCDWPENVGCQNGGDPTEPAPTTPGGGGGNNPTTPGATRPPPINGCELVSSCPPTNEGNATHFPNPTDCGSFCKCDWGYPVWFDCPDGLHFNPVLQVCDWPENAGCQNGGDPTEPAPTTPGGGGGNNPTTSGATRPPPINGCELVTSCPPTNEGNATHFPNPTDCGSFCKCDWGYPVWFDCPDGLHFNPVLQVCDWPENAGCQNGGDPTEPAPTTPGGGNNPTTPGATRPPPINGCELVTSCPPTNDGDVIQLPNPTDCGSFCKCDWGYPVWIVCPDGLHFNPVLQVCDWPENAGCASTESSSTAKPPSSSTTDVPAATTTVAPSDEFPCHNVCPPAGTCGPTNVPNPDDCTSYCKCENGEGIVKPCPPGLWFDSVEGMCTYPEDAICIPTEPEGTTTAKPNPTDPGSDPGVSTTKSPAPTCPNVSCPEVNGEFALHLPNPDDCGSFCKCDWGVGYLMDCPAGLHFNAALQVCDWPANAGCDPGSDPGVTTVNPGGETTVKPGGETTTTSSAPTCPKVVCPELNGEFALHLPNPDDCGSFCKCDWGVAYYFDCPDGLHFNAALQVCDWPEDANCQPGADPPAIPDPLWRKH